MYEHIIERKTIITSTLLYIIIYYIILLYIKYVNEKLNYLCNVHCQYFDLYLYLLYIYNMYYLSII